MRDDIEIEELLARYRPANPPPGLRQRVLQQPIERRPVGFRLFWPSMAALLAISVGLHWATQHLLNETSLVLRTPTPWTHEANEAVELFNGNGSARPYIALALAASSPSPSARFESPRALSGKMENLQ